MKKPAYKIMHPKLLSVVIRRIVNPRRQMQMPIAVPIKESKK